MHRADKLTTSYADSRNLGILSLVKPLGPAQACNGIALPSPLWSTMCIQGSSFEEIRTQKHWGLIGRRLTTPSRVLFPRNVLPSSFSHCSFILTRKNAALFKNITSLFLRNFIFTLLKLRKSKIAYVWGGGVSVERSNEDTEANYRTLNRIAIL